VKRKYSSRRKTERGAALLLVMFAILLVSGLGVLMYFSSGTESRIDANYGGGLNAYYAARFGLEEVRDRARYSAFGALSAGGIAELLPTDIAGNPNGVLYILNPANGENVDPTDINNRYFDNQLCHDFNSGVPHGTNCTVTPAVGGWNLPPITSVAVAGTALPYKWVRVNIKTNRISDPYFVDGVGSSSTLDTRICWDGFNEQLSPGGTNPACDANGMRTVFMLTSLAVTPGVAQNASRKLLRSELVAPSIRPPGAITIDAASASVIFSGGASPGIPTTAIDGRVHKVDGTLAPTNVTLTDIYQLPAVPTRCSAVAAVATDSTQTSTQLAQGMYDLRKAIVQAANASCNVDGSTTTTSTATCTPGMWWVRGTDPSPRFAINPTVSGTSGTTGTSGGTGTSGEGGEHHGGSSGGSGTTTPPPPTTTTTILPGGITALCDPSIASCYVNLDLTAPELLALSATVGSLPHVPTVVLPDNPSSAFVGGTGNSVDPAIYQTPTSLPNTLPNEVRTLSALVDMNRGQANYFAPTPANLSPTYGSQTNPAIVVITDPGNLTPSLLLQQSLTGFGVLVVPNDFEIGAGIAFNWTGIVLVRGGAAKFVVGAGATGFINGSLMLQPTSGTAGIVQTSTGSSSGTSPYQSTGFRISYSCDAIDMAFNALPFKVISSSESSF
jgi:hypothetical protein